MNRLHNNARVLIADGARALVLRNDGDAVSLNLKLVKSYGQDNPPTHEQGADKPGRINDSLGRRSAMEATGQVFATSSTISSDPTCLCPDRRKPPSP